MKRTTLLLGVLLLIVIGMLPVSAAPGATGTYSLSKTVNGKKTVQNGKVQDAVAFGDKSYVQIFLFSKPLKNRKLSLVEARDGSIGSITFHLLNGEPKNQAVRLNFDDRPLSDISLSRYETGIKKVEYKPGVRVRFTANGGKSGKGQDSAGVKYNYSSNCSIEVDTAAISK
jgi:hypothetical protein